MLDERSVQTVSRPFNIFKNKENVESMLIESLNQLKFDSTRFQQAFDIFFTLSTVSSRFPTRSFRYTIKYENVIISRS